LKVPTPTLTFSSSFPIAIPSTFLSIAPLNSLNIANPSPIKILGLSTLNVYSSPTSTPSLSTFDTISTIFGLKIKEPSPIFLRLSSPSIFTSIFNFSSTFPSITITTSSCFSSPFRYSPSLLPSSPFIWAFPPSTNVTLTYSMALPSTLFSEMVYSSPSSNSTFLSLSSTIAPFDIGLSSTLTSTISSYFLSFTVTS